MGRVSISSILGAVFTALVFFAALPVARTHAAPRNPAASSATNIRFNGVDYTDSRVFLGRLGYKASWVQPQRVLRLQAGASVIELESEKRDVSLNGLRVVMGEAALFRGNTLYVSRIDADKLFMPVLRPSAVKAAPPPALRVIVIDPGHGGSDTGTQNKALKLDEKAFTLDVSMRLRALLQKQGYRVVMTRTDDRFVSLPERAEISNKAGADLFISVHFNAVAGSPLVRGSETFVMTPRFQRSSSSATRERSDSVANPGNAYDSWNTLLGYQMHAQVLGKLGSVDRGLRRARFAVLRLVNSPGVLIEAGYLSNKEEAQRIATPAYRAALAEALAQGVRAYANSIASAQR